MVIGMLGIFLVIGIIILATYALNKAFSRKKDSDKEDE
ncbi:MAG: oxaloacetate decarboxylase [Eubacterium sp.]|nr:oxaloacetate decarboxylase [Eubacterium sp.]